MENYNIWKVIGRQWLLIVIIIVIVSGFAWVASGNKSSDIAASVSITAISQTEYTNSNLIIAPDPIANGKLLVTTSIDWISDPNLVNDVLNGVDVDISEASFSDLGGYFVVNRSSEESTSYRVTFNAKDQAQAQKIKDKLAASINLRSEDYNAHSKSGVKMSFLISDPTTSNNEGSVPITPLAGGLIGVVFALVIASIVDTRKA